MSKQTVEHLDTLIKKNWSRIKRAMTAIDKMEKQRSRLLKAAVRTSIPAHPTVDSETTLGAMPPPDLAVAHPLAKAVVRVEDEIPAFLRRQSPDPVAEQIRSEVAEKKKQKARGKIAKMKAKQSGETKKMPLTGRAALEAIRNG